MIASFFRQGLAWLAVVAVASALGVGLYAGAAWLVAA